MSASTRPLRATLGRLRRTNDTYGDFILDGGMDDPVVSREPEAERDAAIDATAAALTAHLAELLMLLDESTMPREASLAAVQAAIREVGFNVTRIRRPR